MRHVGKQPVVGLDLNAARVRVVTAAAGQAPALLPLAGEADLPLVVSLEGRTPEVGRAGLLLGRRAPHLACTGFLPFLGEPREWSAGRHRLDAAQALALVFDRLSPLVSQASALALAVPAYLTADQAAILTQTAANARIGVSGWIATPLALALTGYAEQPWNGPALILDLDSHALTWAVVAVEFGQARLLGVQTLPHLDLGAWKGRLLDMIADRCVRQSRRDPRDSGAAEQALYDQLDAALEACRRGQVAELLIHLSQWGQNLLVRPDELAAACAPLMRRALAEMQAQRDRLPRGPSPVVLVTDAASRMPGLVRALDQAIGASDMRPMRVSEGDDFGEGLIEDEIHERGSVSVLSPDAAARAACELAARWQRGELESGAVEVAPLPAPLPADAGPARLQFRHQDHPFRGPAFLLGRHADCDLVFDSDQYPTVSGRHCEIVYERRTFLLRDRSRHGTLVNDRPVVEERILQAGDWIRLGPGGPLVRFLGQAADQLKLMTTA